MFGGTGGGKTSGRGRALALHYRAAIICRTGDLMIVVPGAPQLFNFLDYEASRQEQGGGLTVNIVQLLTEIAKAIDAKSAGKGISPFRLVGSPPAARSSHRTTGQ